MAIRTRGRPKKSSVGRSSRRRSSRCWFCICLPNVPTPAPGSWAGSRRSVPGLLAVNTNTIYPLLRRLEERGFILGEWEHPTKRSRRYYRITTKAEPASTASKSGMLPYLEIACGIDRTIAPRAVRYRRRLTHTLHSRKESSTMSTYRAPLRDMQFVLHELAGIEKLRNCPVAKIRSTSSIRFSKKPGVCRRASSIRSIAFGDKEGCTWNDGEVTTPTGFKEAYKKFADAGWIGLPVPAEYGGQGLAANSARAHARDVERRRTSASPTARCSIRARSKRSSSSAPTNRRRSTFRISFPANGPERCA